MGNSSAFWRGATIASVYAVAAGMLTQHVIDNNGVALAIEQGVASGIGIISLAALGIESLWDITSKFRRPKGLKGPKGLSEIEPNL